MKDKIVLTTINTKKDLYSVTADEFSAIAPNVQLGLLGSYIKSKDIDVAIVDSEVDKLSIDGLIDMIEKEQPLLFGIIVTGANPSSSTMNMAGVIDFYKKFNQTGSKVKTFICGPHPTVLPERSLKETGADFVVRGEGYETIVALFHALHRKVDMGIIPGLSYFTKDNGRLICAHNKDDILIRNLDVLPMIDWEMMNPSRYRAHNWHCFGDINNRFPYAIIWTSFGCPFKCIYCCINNLFGKRIQRFRSIDRVIEEISILVEKYNVKHLKVLDELFVVNPRRIEEFCDKLEKKGYDLNMWSYARVDTINRHLLKRLKKVGMNWISYGFESAAPEILKGIKKEYAIDRMDEVIRMTRDEGISICANVMFGLPDDDADSMNQTYDFLVKYNFEWVNMYPVFAYPGTELYKNIEEPKSWKTYALYGYDCVPMGTRYLTPKEVLKFRDEAFINYYGRSDYQRMIEKKFDPETKEHIIRMLKIPLKRKLLESN
jgi:radical SAM superfamily enzyme YgiQ (UPF0313 family)